VLAKQLGRLFDTAPRNRARNFLMLVAGAAMFISSFASLAAARRPAQGDDEPRPGVWQLVEW